MYPNYTFVGFGCACFRNDWRINVACDGRPPMKWLKRVSYVHCCCRHLSMSDFLNLFWIVQFVWLGLHGVYVNLIIMDVGIACKQAPNVISGVIHFKNINFHVVEWLSCCILHRTNRWVYTANPWPIWLELYHKLLHSSSFLIPSYDVESGPGLNQYKTATWQKTTKVCFVFYMYSSISKPKQEAL